jgi:hypothetical protein
MNHFFLTQRRKGAKAQGRKSLGFLCVFASLRLCVEFPLFAGTFACQWNSSDFAGVPLSNKFVFITPIAPYGVDGSTIINRDRRRYTNDSTGSLIVSNMFNGRSYRVEFTGRFEDMIITNSFDSTVTGLVNGADPAYLPALPIRDALTIAYSQAAADARFHNVSGDTSTNAIFRGTFKIPAGAAVGYVLTATNADGSAAWSAAGGDGTFDYASLTNKPAPILLLATNNGSSLTNLTAANLVGALPAIDGSLLTGLPNGGPFSASTNTIYPTDFTNRTLRIPGTIKLGTNTILATFWVDDTSTTLLLNAPADANTYHYADLHSRTNSSYLEAISVAPPGLTAIARLRTGGSDTAVDSGFSTNVELILQARRAGTFNTFATLVRLHPTPTNAAQTPFSFDTWATRSGGTIFGLSNNAAHLFSIADNGNSLLSGTNKAAAYIFGDGTVQTTAATGGSVNPLTADLTNGDGIILVGSSVGSGSILIPADRIYGSGDSVLNNAILTGSVDIFANGRLSMASAIFDNSFDIYAYGEEAMQEAIFGDSHDIYAFGHDTMDSFVGNTNHDIYAFGSALRGAGLDNSSDIYAFGNDAGTGLTGDGLTHIFLVGSGSEATASGDWVAGDAAYRYKFPGTAGATFGGPVSVPLTNAASLATDAAGKIVAGVAGGNDPRFTSSANTITARSNVFAAPYFVSKTNYVDRVEATNSSSLDLFGGGAELQLNSSAVQVTAPGGVTLSGGGSFTGIGSGLTTLNGSAISSGTIASARLPSTATTNLSTLASGRVQVGDGGRGVTNASASGAVPIDADGTATTLGQLSSLGVMTNNGVFSVKAYGAVGNGTADDTIPIQNAIAAAKPRGGVVFLPSGTYKIFRPLVLPSAVELRGAGASTIITKPLSVRSSLVVNSNSGSYGVLVADTTGFAVSNSLYIADGVNFEWNSTKTVITNVAGNLISFPNAVVASLQTNRAAFATTTFSLIKNEPMSTNIVVRDLVLDQNRSLTGDTNNDFTTSCVELESAYLSLFDRVVIQNAPADGWSDQGTNGLNIVTLYPSNISWTMNTFQNSVIKNGGRHGVHIGTADAGTLVQGNTLTNLAGFAMFYCAYATESRAIGNYVANCLSGFAGIDFRDYANVIANNTIRACTNHSIDLATSGSDGTGGRCTISGNVIIGRAIYIDQPDCTIIGNTIESALSTSSIKVASGADRTTIQGNVITSLGGGGSVNVEFVGDDDCRLVGNIIKGSSKGIDFQGCSRLLASGNTLSGMTSTWWVFDGTASTNIVIVNNLETAASPVTRTIEPINLRYQRGFPTNVVSWVTALATRYTNTFSSGLLTLGVGNVDAATGTPQATVTIEPPPPNTGLRPTNTFLFTHPGVASFSTFTNWDNVGRVELGEVITITDTSAGSGASVTIAGSVLKAE